MKTLICQQPGVMEYVEKDIPTPADNEVLLKIKAVGICGTDIHAFAGRQPFFSYPRVLGHPRFYVSTSKSIIKALINM
ncbi:alcohol dehydrogenase catalytic domain-containing protein, partial [Escherichia coli]|nr:alcohol dehydrogenase catalytic domain-containing protein [Escherichia coli]